MWQCHIERKSNVRAVDMLSNRRDTVHNSSRPDSWATLESGVSCGCFISSWQTRKDEAGMRNRDAIAAAMVLAALVLGYVVVSSVTPASPGGVLPGRGPITASLPPTQAPNTPGPTPSVAIAPTPIMTDALATALRFARGYGLKAAPTDMHIASVQLGDIPGYAVNDDRAVYIVWLTTPEFQMGIGPGGRVTQVYIVITIDTGAPLLISGRRAPRPEFSSFAWEQVTPADMGRFPVPDNRYLPGGGLPAIPTPSRPTPTPPTEYEPTETPPETVPTSLPPPPTDWLPPPTVIATTIP